MFSVQTPRRTRLCTYNIITWPLPAGQCQHIDSNKRPTGLHISFSYFCFCLHNARQFGNDFNVCVYVGGAVYASSLYVRRSTFDVTQLWIAWGDWERFECCGKRRKQSGRCSESRLRSSQSSGRYHADFRSFGGKILDILRLCCL